MSWLKKTKTPVPTRGYRTATETMNLVYQLMARSGAWLSHLEIARLIGRKGKYPALNDILERMVQIQWLERRESVADNRHLSYTYRALRYDKDGVLIPWPREEPEQATKP